MGILTGDSTGRTSVTSEQVMPIKKKPLSTTCQVHPYSFLGCGDGVVYAGAESFLKQQKEKWTGIPIMHRPPHCSAIGLPSATCPSDRSHMLF